MAYRKRKRSRNLEAAQHRLNALQNIDENIEFSAGFTTESYKALVEDAIDQLHRYNAMLANVDRQKSDLRRLEKKLADANERVFSGIITQFGRDSIEYEMIGGTRKREIRNGSVKPLTYDPMEYSVEGEEDDGEPSGE